jgi:hypothetical protein
VDRPSRDHARCLAPTPFVLELPRSAAIDAPSEDC